MSILIKGMEMPKCCGVCFMKGNCNQRMYREQRPMGCPLVEAQEPHWIPCSERLPEKNGEYLCQEKLGFLYVDTWNGEYWDCAGRAYGIVIAWMPLPEPYEERRQDG